MVDKPEYRKGTGPEQLPQGEAQDLNAPAPGAPPEVAVAAQAQDTQPPQAATAADYQPQYNPQSEDESFITGPTTRPQEPVTHGATTIAGGVSPELRRLLPALVEAAHTPGAPEQMRYIVDFIIRQAG
jgi:hypothetical protein